MHAWLFSVCLRRWGGMHLAIFKTYNSKNFFLIQIDS